MAGLPQNVPGTVEEVFEDFKGRRAGLIKALTADVEKFYQLCDPEKENLCLYGHPNESWEVNLPVEQVPPELPEPALGTNFARGGMLKKDWLSLVAVHSDSWLLSAAFFFGARAGFGITERKKLFEMINEFPTVSEVLNGNAMGPRDQSGKDNSDSKGKSGSKAIHPGNLPKRVEMAVPKGEDSGEAEQGGTLRSGTRGKMSIIKSFIRKVFH